MIRAASAPWLVRSVRCCAEMCRCKRRNCKPTAMEDGVRAFRTWGEPVGKLQSTRSELQREHNEPRREYNADTTNGNRSTSGGWSRGSAACGNEEIAWDFSVDLRCRLCSSGGDVREVAKKM